MMSALLKPFFTEEEYLAIERASDHRSEYIDGEMYAMAGAGEQHATIIANIVSALHGQFRDRPCKVYSTDLRVRVAESGLYTYPDVIALCGKTQLLGDPGDTLLNPQLIVEVLSPGTAFYDRVEKFHRYCQIPSFCDYVLVSQNQHRVEHRVRQSDRSDDWEVRPYGFLGDRLFFPSLEATLTLKDIYDKVQFTAEPLPPWR